MRHLKSGKKLNRTASHRKATLQSLASNLIEHKRIKTTTAKAKALRPYVEKLVTKAVHALDNEQNGKLDAGQNIDIHTRRVVARELKRKDILQELFDSIAPVVTGRTGGYTRIIKIGARRGDSAEMALIELVDWSGDQDSSFAKSKTKNSKTESKEDTSVVDSVKEKATEVVDKVEAKAEDVTEVVEEKLEEAKETVEEVTEQAEEKAEEVIETAEEKTEEVAEAVEEKVEEVTEQAEEVAEDAKEKAEEITEDAKDAAEDVADKVKGDDEEDKEDSKS
jgi:large subunit ribosomal protein L17